MFSKISTFFSRASAKFLPSPREFIVIMRSLTLKERILLYALGLTFIVSLLFFVHFINNRFIVNVPAHGGTLIEGELGVPHFINPLLANSDTDQDIVQLIYSGLLRAGKESNYILDLAESYSISEDGRVYTFILKDDLKFSDGEPITSADVAFTVQIAQDKTIKSPRLSNWEGVVVETPNEKTVKFILKKPYAPFLENTTMGILPKHIWQNVPKEEFAYSTFNTNPVGSGPYLLDSIDNDSAGIPQSFTLKSNRRFALGRPFIDKIVLKFYPSEDKLASAYAKGEISSVAGLSPDLVKSLKNVPSQVVQRPLPRVFGLFFNQNQTTILSNYSVRSALSKAIEKRDIVDQILLGYGVVLESPIPSSTIDSSLSNALKDHASESRESRLSGARKILTDAGWIYNEQTKLVEKKVQKETRIIELSIATINAPELKKIAEQVAKEWTDLGIKVTISYYEYGDLTQNIIRPRKFDVLLFGTIIGRFPDLYAFWHSSQRLDPGLNIAQYTNIKVDGLLEEARDTVDRNKRMEILLKIETEINKDLPAVFLYSPSLIYIVPEDLQGLDLSSASNPSERFSLVHQWYLQTDAVWKIFKN